MFIIMYMFNLLYVWQQTITKNIYEKYLPNGSVQFGTTVRLAIKKYIIKNINAQFTLLYRTHTHTHRYLMERLYPVIWHMYVYVHYLDPFQSE